MKALVSNRIVTSPAYQKILHSYNEQLQQNGKVNNKKFFEIYVAPEIPNYSLQAWYQFLLRYKTPDGILAVEVAPAGTTARETRIETEGAVAATMLSNAAATTKFIQTALNIGAARAQQIAEHPELMTAKEAMDFAIKAMKAQDSRMHAIGKIREDNREQEKFDRTFSEAAM